MLLVLEDDGVLYVYETVEEAVYQVEALDAEETFRTAFDETGQTYAIEWNHLPGLLELVNEGYSLRPTGKKDVAGLLRALESAEYIEPSEFEDQVREIQARLTRGGTSEQESH